MSVHLSYYLSSLKKSDFRFGPIYVWTEAVDTPHGTTYPAECHILENLESVKTFQTTRKIHMIQHPHKTIVF